MNESSSENLDQSLSALMDNEASELEFRRILKASASEPEAPNKGLCQKWRRYHMIASFMRKEPSLNIDVDVVAAVSESLKYEETYQSNSESNADHLELDAAGQRRSDSRSKAAVATKSWRDMLVQTSVAASVAVACVMGAQHLNMADLNTVELNEGIAVQEDTQPIDEHLASSQTTVFEAPNGFDLPVARASAVAAVSERQSYTPVPAARMHNGMSDAERRANERLLQLHFEQLMRQHAEAQAESGNLGVLPYARIPVDSQQK